MFHYSLRQMEDRFKALEAQITDLMSVLKTKFADLEAKIASQNYVFHNGPSTSQLQARSCDSSTSSAGHPCPLEGDESVRDTLPKLEKEAGVGGDLPPLSETIGPREEEIAKYNGTVHLEPYPDGTLKNAASQLSKVFTYYWRIHGIAVKINSWDPRRSLRSPSFYVNAGGYRMYLLVFPRQNYENLYVHVGITLGVNDANLQWPFPLKHRIQLLDQVRVPSNSSRKRISFPSATMTPVDLSSRLWNPAMLCSASVWRRPVAGDSTECVGLGFPHGVLKSKNYIHEDSIVIKLTVYLT
ncbi:TNF receptor-associated factor 6-like isoform X2 [Ischnura elegans]|uniref:TNF receptor-associated factor 6-like isoform X2 n=1 Tax=Ischnura elegans TaxID=197161 RepID=UPI001ED8ACE2|nr:TNF receptor-associated factor 6-like isoform X2 [Ischnura elegans]